HHRAPHRGGGDPGLPVLRDRRLVALALHLSGQASGCAEEGPRRARLGAGPRLLEGPGPGADLALADAVGGGGGGAPMKLEVLVDAESAARRAAELVASEARAAVEARGRFAFA